MMDDDGWWTVTVDGVTHRGGEWDMQEKEGRDTKGKRKRMGDVIGGFDVVEAGGAQARCTKQRRACG